MNFSHNLYEPLKKLEMTYTHTIAYIYKCTVHTHTHALTTYKMTLIHTANDISLERMI